MKIELLGALDYNKLETYLNNRVGEVIQSNNSFIEYLDKLKEAGSKVTVKNVVDQVKYYLDSIGVNPSENFLTTLEHLDHQAKFYQGYSSDIIKKIKEELKSQNKYLEEMTPKAIEEIRALEIERRTNIVATAGRLSRFSGTVFEILETVEGRDFDKNVEFIKRVIGMGHDSTTDHDYCVFAIQDVSPVIEQTIIEERFSSFTIKSRREVDFSKVGFYVPDFHDEEGNILPNNESLKEKYRKYMQSLFDKYAIFTSKGISKEDARFVLPYCYNSNIIMGIDAHTLKDMIIKFTKTKYSKIQELREFGERLYEIAKENIKYIIPEIDKVPVNLTDPVDEYLGEVIDDKSYEILDGPKLLTSSSNIDDTILISSIMRRYQYDHEKATKVYNELVETIPNFKQDLMHKIAFEGDKLELSQVSFEFQVPLSFAVLTHLTRHRTHHIMVPDFAPTVDLQQYKVPPKIAANPELKEFFDDIFTYNKIVYDSFKGSGVCDEDLVYFTLSGNTVNALTNMDGRTVEHILGLRECSKAQWETQAMARGMHKEIDAIEGAEIYSSILGSTCMTQGYCKEGKESCGKINAILNKNKTLELKAE